MVNDDSELLLCDGLFSGAQFEGFSNLTCANRKWPLIRPSSQKKPLLLLMGALKQFRAVKLSRRYHFGASKWPSGPVGGSVSESVLFRSQVFCLFKVVNLSLSLSSTVIVSMINYCTNDRLDQFSNGCANAVWAAKHSPDELCPSKLHD